METSLIKIGDSMGLIIPKKILSKLKSLDKVDMKVKDGNILIIPIVKDKPRKNWEMQFAGAMKMGYIPEDDSLEKLQNDFDDKEWTW